MMKRVFMGVAVATVLACANPAKADAKVVTVKAAAKEMVKVSDKAYKDKKTHTVKFTLKGNDTFKVANVYLMAGELETATAAGCFDTRCSVPEPSSYKFGSGSNKNCSYKFVKGNGSFTYSVTFSGSNKGFRKRYYDHQCAEKITEEIKSLTKGKSQGMKAIIVMDWLSEHAKYHTKKNAYDFKTDAVDVYKGNAHSECQGLAGLWSGLAKVAGIKKCGCVSSDKMDHMWNWLEVDGKKYYLDFQILPDSSMEYDEWSNIDLDTTDEELKSAIERYIDNQEQYGLKIAWEVSKEEYCLWTKKECAEYYEVSDKGWKYFQS